MTSLLCLISTRRFRSREPRSFGELGRDERGVVLLAGIVGGALLVGALWHLVSVGDAIIWRERAQDTADAAAFQNAVLQARGMNVIVVLNLIMALAMSVLVTWRMIEFILAGLIVFFTILCLGTGFACAVPPPIARLEGWFLQKDPGVAEKVVKVCAGVNVLERVVATAGPMFAAVHASVDTATDYDASFVVAVSPSIASPEFMSLPAAADGDNRALINRVVRHTIDDNITKCLRGRRPPPARRQGVNSRWNVVAQERLGLFVSLPVMDDRLGALCAQAGNFYDAAMTDFFSGGGSFALVKSWLDYASEMKGTMFGAAPSLFCMPPAAGAANADATLQAEIDKQVNAACSQAEDSFSSDAFRGLSEEERAKNPFYVKPEDRPLPRLSTRNQDLPIDPRTGFNREKCKEKTREDSALKRAAEARSALDKVMECVKPAKVWESATNGNLFMQSFSFVLRGVDSERADDMLEVGDRQQLGNVVPIETGWIRAQAEMYFDCTGNWASCDPNAMWQVKWRARLRRIQPLDRMAGDAFALTLATGISHGLQRLFGNWAYGTGDDLGTDAKYGNLSNLVRDPIQWLVYELNPLVRDPGENDPVIH